MYLMLREDPAIVEERRSFVDKCLRRAWSPFDIAKELSTNADYEHLVMSVKSKLKEDEGGRLTYLVRTRLIRHDIEAIKLRYRREVTPEESEGALGEYVARLEHLYEEAFRSAADAPDHRDKIAAIRVAAEVAEKKALAMGVDIEPKVTEGLGRLGAGMGLVLTQLVGVAAGKMQLPEPQKELPAPTDAIDAEFSEIEEKVKVG